MSQYNIEYIISYTRFESMTMIMLVTIKFNETMINRVAFEYGGISSFQHALLPHLLVVVIAKTIFYFDQEFPPWDEQLLPSCIQKKLYDSNVRKLVSKLHLCMYA